MAPNLSTDGPEYLACLGGVRDMRLLCSQDTLICCRPPVAELDIVALGKEIKQGRETTMVEPKFRYSKRGSVSGRG